MANHCRDCGEPVIMGRRPKADGTMGKPQLCDPWPSSHYANPKHIAAVSNGEPKKVKRVEPKLSGDRLAVMMFLRNLGYKKGPAYELARDAEGDDLPALLKSATAERAAEITS